MTIFRLFPREIIEYRIEYRASHRDARGTRAGISRHKHIVLIDRLEIHCRRSGSSVVSLSRFGDS